MKDYARFTLSRFAVPYFVKGAKEVHIVFDSPGRIPHTPKAFEQSRRDTEHPTSPDHQHYEFSDSAQGAIEVERPPRLPLLQMATGTIPWASIPPTSP